MERLPEKFRETVYWYSVTKEPPGDMSLNGTKCFVICKAGVRVAYWYKCHKAFFKVQSDKQRGKLKSVTHWAIIDGKPQ